MTANPSLRRKTWEVLEGTGERRRLTWIPTLLILLIMGSVFVAVLATEEGLRVRYPAFFGWAELFFGVVFSIEYAARWWCSVEAPGARESRHPRLRFATSFYAIVDMLAVLPFYLWLLGLDFGVARIIRLLRLIRLVKVIRYSRALSRIGVTLADRKGELAITLAAAVMLLLFAAALMHVVEGDAQPEHFGSVPAAMWWAVVTLTTVGYGDVYPVTFYGRLVGGLIALIGVGLVAMPAGILASGFSTAVRRETETCPRCGFMWEEGPGAPIPVASGDDPPTDSQGPG